MGDDTELKVDFSFLCRFPTPGSIRPSPQPDPPLSVFQ